MPRLTETAIEDFAIQLFEKQGFTYIQHAEDETERADYSQVLLTARLSAAIRRINPRLPPEVFDDAIKQVQRIQSPDLLANNEAFHRLLTEGVSVSYQKDGAERGELVWLVDFDNPLNNEFVVANQFTVIENHVEKRPDMVLFVNGLPLVVIELKNPADEKATVRSGFRQVETYKQAIPSLFTFNAITVISDGLEAKAGTISADYSRFMKWKSIDGKAEASKLVSELEVLIRGMLNRETLLDLVRHFIVFEKGSRKDKKTGQVSVTTVKKLAACHQYYAVNAAVASTLRAAGMNRSHDGGAEPIPSPALPLKGREHVCLRQAPRSQVNESPASYGLPAVSAQPSGDRKAGVVWHTQGSGKSLSMVFYTGKVVLAMNNPTIVVITDRNDLDDQLFETFAASRQLLRQKPVQANSRNDLKDLLKVNSGGVVFTTIQKFQPETGNVFEQLSERENIVVIADEAHRTQYGFTAKTIDDKDADGNVIGKKVVYGFAKYLRDALPNATYLGFTGTPIEKTDINTPAVFGNYVDIYDIAQAVEDGATVRIYYESRLAKVALSDEGRELIRKLDEEIEEEDLSETQKAKAKWTKMEALIGSKNRIATLARDIVTHFEARQTAIDGKGMIVTMSRRIAAELYAEIIKLRPEWDEKDLNKGVIKVVMTTSSSDGPEINRHSTTKDKRKTLADRMKDPSDPLKLVIVRDMWLTGFDVPNLHTLYIDKPMRGHSLMQAIARVNRVYPGKDGGLVVDYLGIAADLKEALSFYSDSGGRGDPALAQEQAVQTMFEKLEIVSAMFNESGGFSYEDYFDADTAKKLSLILAAEDHILGLDDGKKRFIDQVTALSQAFAIAMPHDQAVDVRDEVGFFQAVKARLVKFETGGSRSDEELETAIRQVIDQALISEQVVDVFDAAGIKKPDISILSDEFLQELKNKQHKNIAIEVLKKLLNDEIKVRSKKNLVESKRLLEMLEDAIKRYQNKILTAAEFIDSLINISKELVESDAAAQEMGLSDPEYAFYTAVANNQSARELMQKDKLRELAVELFDQVRRNASIDWTLKESAKAKLKVIIKRTLRKYGYPPDMQLLATETVLRQAEMIANELVGESP
jgi:type I restriction enzyme R subunit